MAAQSDGQNRHPVGRRNPKVGRYAAPEVGLCLAAAG